MSLYELEKDIRKYVSIGSGVPSERIIPAENTGPSPQNLFASLLLITNNLVGQGQTIYVSGENDDGHETIFAYTRTQYRSSYSLQFYRKGAVAAARKFRDWAETDLAKIEEDKREFRIANQINVERISEIISDAWEERASMELMIDHAYDFKQDAGKTEEVSISVFGSQTIRENIDGRDT